MSVQINALTDRYRLAGENPTCQSLHYRPRPRKQPEIIWEQTTKLRIYPKPHLTTRVWLTEIPRGGQGTRRRKRTSTPYYSRTRPRVCRPYNVVNTRCCITRCTCDRCLPCQPWALPRYQGDRSTQQGAVWKVAGQGGRRQDSGIQHLNSSTVGCRVAARTSSTEGWATGVCRGEIRGGSCLCSSC